MESERGEYNNDRGRGLEEMHRVTRERGSGSGVRDLSLSLSLALSFSLSFSQDGSFSTM